MIAMITSFRCRRLVTSNGKTELRQCGTFVPVQSFGLVECPHCHSLYNVSVKVERVLTEPVTVADSEELPNGNER